MEPLARRQPRTNKQIIFIVCLYVLITISNKFKTSSDESHDSMLQKIQTNTDISMASFLVEIDSDEYEGIWRRDPPLEQPSQFLRGNKGKFTFSVERHSSHNGSIFSLHLNIKNGDYIDDGSYILSIMDLHEANWKTLHQPNRLIATLANETSPLENVFSENWILQNIRTGKLNLTSLNIEFSSVEKKVTKKVMLGTEKETIYFYFNKQKSNIFGTVCLALVLFIISFSEFSVSVELLKKFMDGDENPSHYSLLTMTMALMWDAILCLLAFIEAFQAEENIILFIIPAFIFTILFTNIELRIMFAIYQSNQGQSERNLLCFFNFLCYGSIVLIYPLLVLTNLRSYLFVIFSLIYLPQIYTNATVGKRPDPGSFFYNEFLSYRFLIFIYLRCFPLNIFSLKANYVLGFGILALIALQFGLLWLQKLYGPRRIFPTWMLPTIYDYSVELELNESAQNQLEEECSICLGPLSKEPEGNREVPYMGLKMMRTPCNHIYHGECLTEWFKFKMECPQCRSKLPPYE